MSPVVDDARRQVIPPNIILGCLVPEWMFSTTVKKQQNTFLIFVMEQMNVSFDRFRSCLLKIAFSPQNDQIVTTGATPNLLNPCLKSNW